jgi:hypothetical protein
MTFAQSIQVELLFAFRTPTQLRLQLLMPWARTSTYSNASSSARVQFPLLPTRQADQWCLPLTQQVDRSPICVLRELNFS